jgi:hypothetical protein
MFTTAPFVVSISVLKVMKADLKLPGAIKGN